MRPTPTCGAMKKQRHTSCKVEAKNPALWKTGTQKGSGSQWCNRLPCPLEMRGGRSCERYAFCTSHLIHPPLKLAHAQEGDSHPVTKNGRSNDALLPARCVSYLRNTEER